jgi:hypothetical protein
MFGLRRQRTNRRETASPDQLRRNHYTRNREIKLNLMEIDKMHNSTQEMMSDS